MCCFTLRLRFIKRRFVPGFKSLQAMVQAQVRVPIGFFSPQQGVGVYRNSHIFRCTHFFRHPLSIFRIKAIIFRRRCGRNPRREKKRFWAEGYFTARQKISPFFSFSFFFQSIRNILAQKKNKKETFALQKMEHKKEPSERTHATARVIAAR